MSAENTPSKSRRFPQHWDVVPFNKAFFDKTGGNPKIKRNQYKEFGKLPIIDQGQEYIGGYIDNLDLKCKAPIPCILFGDHTKVIKYVDFPFALGADGVKVLVPNEKLDSRFSYYYLNQLRLPGDAGYSRHFKFLKESYVPIPTIEEQKRIAAILDKADAIRRKRRQAIQLADEFLRSVFLDMFGDPVNNPKGWKKASVGEKLTFLTSGSRGWAKYYSTEGRLFLRIQNIGANQLLLDDVAFVNPPDSAEARRTAAKAGDVLLSITADLGRTAVIPNDFPPAHINQHLSILRFDDVEPLFASAYLASKGGQNQIQKLNREGVKAGLNFENIRSLNIYLPPKDLQKKWSDIYSKNLIQKSLLKHSLRNQNELFNSIAQRAFGGEL